MKQLVLLLSLVALAGYSSPAPSSSRENPQVAAWQARAQGITIIRDDWGVLHIYGKTDADVVNV